MDLFQTLNFDTAEEFLPTNVDSIDTILGGGIPVGRVTEVYGQAGVGKTQLCLQLCANARLPKNFGGLNGKSVYLDCHGGFNSNRLNEICNEIQNKAPNSMGKNFLDDVYYKRIDDIDEISQALDCLVRILGNSNVKLLILDSIAFHFRYPILDGTPDIKATLQGIIQKLNTLAYTFKMAVIVTNQMTTRILKPSGNGDNGSELIPALGESWSHSCSTSLQLDFVKMETFQNKRNILRELKVVKSPIVKYPSKTYFTISEKGICDYTVKNKT